MRRPSWKEEKDKIEEELDLQEEQFISERQLMSWYNDAIDKCESHIHNLNENWFQADQPFILSNGVKEYDLPADIFGVSISSIQYDDRNKDYDLERITSQREIPYENAVQTQDTYSYRVYNNKSTGPKIRIYPTPNKDYLSEITISYIRNASRLDYNAINRDQQEIDIPEFSSYCRQYVICKAHEKEKQWQNLTIAKAELDDLENLMKQTLGRKEKDGQSTMNPNMNDFNDFGLGE